MSEIIAVIGATGAQGGGVVDALLGRGKFRVRALTRRPGSAAAQALEARGCEVVPADLDDAASLERAFAGCHGAFVVTNAWDPGAPVDEYAQGKRAVEAAKAAGVQHLVWSTLPNCSAISGGRYVVPHFTNKARVDEVVRAAGFRAFTFVEAPMYFQNLTSPTMAPQPQDDGNMVWAFPMSADVKCIHNGDIGELGTLVGRVFEEPKDVGDGQYLAMTPGAVSWREIVATLNSQGHDISYSQVPPEVWDARPFPAAKEMREMMEFWEAYTYFGPEADAKIARAQALVAEGFTSFAEWASKNMPASGSAVTRYLTALERADAEAVEAVLADDATLITPHGVVRGRKRVGAAMLEARQHAIEAGIDAFDEIARFGNDRLLYLLVRSEPRGQMGMHVLTTEAGKITAHLSTLHPEPSYLKPTLCRHGLTDHAPDDAVSANTKAVIDRHLASFGDMDPWLANKAEDILFITQSGVLRGREQLRRAFTSDVRLAPEGYAEAVKTIYRTHVGRVGHLFYSAEPFVSVGMDTWIVEGDEIAVWAYAASPMLPNLPDWLRAAAAKA